MKKTIITLLMIFVCACCFAATFTFTVAQDLYVDGYGKKYYVVKVTWTGWYSDEVRSVLREFRSAYKEMLVK